GRIISEGSRGEQAEHQGYTAETVHTYLQGGKKGRDQGSGVNHTIFVGLVQKEQAVATGCHSRQGPCILSLPPMIVLPPTSTELPHVRSRHGTGRSAQSGFRCRAGRLRA